MNESNDRMLADWLREGPERGPREGLERALAATHRVGQRPGWTLPERWIPMQTVTRTSSLRPLLAIVMLALLIVALVATALFIGSQRRPLPPPFGPARNGAVVFERDGDLMIADALDGSERTLVGGPERDFDPVFSDQGDRIAFVRQMPDDSWIVMTVSQDGSEAKALATPSGLMNLLGWSPDGSALLASIFGRDSSKQIHVISSDGSGSRPLDLSFFETGPASWRPGGRHIAFRGEVDTTEADVHVGLYIADANGTSVQQLRIGPVEQLGGLEWSPDGNHLSFTRDGPGDSTQINIADIAENGTLNQLHTLRFDPMSSDESSAKWSPDGSRLAFVLIKGSRSQIGVFNPDGSGYRIVVPDVWDEGGGDFVWSPDGRSLVRLEEPMHIDGHVGPWGKVWSVEVATGEETEVQTPVQSWQRLAP